MQFWLPSENNFCEGLLMDGHVQDSDFWYTVYALLAGSIVGFSIGALFGWLILRVLIT